jgi:leucyl/phenylalanyl-tRNA--protein transferase
MSDLSPELILHAYRLGLFPMAEGREDAEVHWVEPRRRGILPLHGFHISRSLRRAILRGNYQIRSDSAFRAVMEACADREETWINAEILRVFTELHRMGHAHSLEVWDGEALIGGVYGLAIGRGFFAESMFSRRRDASKIALAWLMHRLRAGGFTLCDTQFLTPHLASLGGIEVSRPAYRALLVEALQGRASFDPPGYQPSCGTITSSPSSTGASSITGASGVTQRNTQTS